MGGWGRLRPLSRPVFLSENYLALSLNPYLAVKFWVCVVISEIVPIRI